MASTIRDFQNRATTLLQACSFQDAPSHMAGMLEWMEKTIPLTAILHELRTSRDIDSLLQGVSPHRPPKTRGPDDQARIGLFFFEHAEDEEIDFVSWMFSLVLSTVGDLHYTFSCAKQQYIGPFLQHVEER